jgi:alkyl sulfatase BDS1-like metallo-beta-lactamase superfamily hydrolase
MSIVLLGSTSGSCTLQEQAVAGTTTLTLPTTSGTVLTAASTDTANSLNAGLGVNQTWQSVVGSRALGTTYTNSTGKPIMVNVAATIINTTTITAVVDGVTVAQENGTGASSNAPATVSFIVPNGSTYSVSNSGSTTLTLWAELR